MYKLLTAALALIALAGLIASPSVTHAQAPDPLSVVGRLSAALSAGDVEGALALFAEDAVVTDPLAGQFVGKAQIRNWVQGVVAQNAKIEASNFQVSGNKITYSARVALPDLQRLGIAALEGTSEVTVQGDKIKSFAFTLSPTSAAQLQAAMGPPGAGPRTGGVPGHDYVAGLALIGLIVLVSLGLALRRQAARP